MNRHLVFIKHAMPEINPALPASAWGLSSDGQRSSQKLAAWLKNYRFSAIYASPEKKAQQTARILASELALVVQTHFALHEHRRPQAGLLNKEDFEQTIAALFARPKELVFGTESADQALTRFGQAVDEICANDSGDICIVAHGTVISLLAADRCGLDGFTLWQRLGLPALIIIGLPEYQIEQIVPTIV